MPPMCPWMMRDIPCPYVRRCLGLRAQWRHLLTISIPPLQFDVVERKPRGQLQDCGRAKWDWSGEPFAYGCGQDRRARHGRSAWSGKVRIVARARDIYTMLAIALCWCSERLPRREFLVAVGRRLPRETSPYGDAKARPARLPRSESPDAGHVLLPRCDQVYGILPVALPSPCHRPKLASRGSTWHPAVCHHQPPS